MAFFLNACSSYHYGSRSFPEVVRLSRENNFLLSKYNSSYAPILTSFRPGDSNTLHIYIEGDGLAWRTKYEPSFDPTPADPIALKLAILDASSATTIYLGRPGQYFKAPQRSIWDWTHRRFSKETIDLYSHFLDDLRLEYPQSKIVLLGYSGGATLALLLAASRSDISKVITFAGLLDPEKWIEINGYSPLEGSLNPTKFHQELDSTSQIHFVGENDTVVTSPVIKSYQSSFHTTAPVVIQKVSGVTHWHGWESFWEGINSSIWNGKMHSKTIEDMKEGAITE